MKPVAFDYRSPTSLDEALSAFGNSAAGTDDGGDGAVVLAGGQSLLIDLRYRAVRPRLVVDLNNVAGLDSLSVTGDGRLRIGALVRHAALEHLPGDDPLARLFRRMARHIAHPPIRARGTFVGSLVYAHPSAEWPALAVALDATIVLAGTGGERRVPAAEWFTGPFRTARRPGEIAVAVEVPRLGTGTAIGFVEHRRTHGSFAQVAVLAVVTTEDGRVGTARIGVAGGADRPLRATGAEAVLTGAGPDRDAIRAAAEAAAAESDPVTEPHCPADYRRHVVGVLTGRALSEALRWS